MRKMNQKKPRELYEAKNGIEIVKNQLIESYQSGVVEDRLKNNRAVHSFNNQSK